MRKGSEDVSNPGDDEIIGNIESGRTNGKSSPPAVGSGKIVVREIAPGSPPASIEDCNIQYPLIAKPPSKRAKVLSQFIGTVVSEIILFPLDTIRIRQQVEVGGRQYASIPGAAMTIFQQDGFAGFFRGLTPKLLQSCALYTLLSYIQAIYKELFRCQFIRDSTVWENLGIDSLASASARTCTMPLDTVSSINQVEKSSISNIVRELIRRDGIRGLWTGWTLTMALSINPGLTYMFQTLLLPQQKAKFRRSSSSDENTDASAMIMSYISGLAKFLATLLTYPLIRAKSIQQTGKGKGILQVLAAVFHRANLPFGIFKGLGATLWKNVLFTMVQNYVRQLALRQLHNSGV